MARFYRTRRAGLASPPHGCFPPVRAGVRRSSGGRQPPVRRTAPLAAMIVTERPPRRPQPSRRNTMRSLTIVRGILAGASALVVAAALIVAQPANPAAAQSSDAAVRQTVRTAHAEAFEALRTGSTAPLRSYSRNAAIQIAEQLGAVSDMGVTVVNAGEPRFEEIG